VGVYSREILYGLAALRPETRFLWCYRPHRLVRGLKSSVPRNCARRLFLESYLPQCSLFHGLNQRLPRARARRTVVTFHDLFVLTGAYSTPEFRKRFAQQAREAAERADLIICVSAFTASQVEDLLRVDKSRLRVVWHGVHLPAEPSVPDQDRENVVLHVGAIQTRKNLIRLVEAFETLDSEWRLVLAGSNGFGADKVLQCIARSPARSRIEVTGYISDSELRNLYRRARMLAFPSLDEGFGIPVLEAMAHGLPVLTSNASALREVAGSAAVLVNPERTDEIRAGLLALSSDRALRQRLAGDGLQIAQRNTWNVAAESTYRVYDELISADR
jgi:glycosyltransferase involved in cell wall biosynthesis